MTDLERRHAALRKTTDRYRDKPFRWGRRDCGKMMLDHLAAMGHKEIKKPRPYKTAIGAKKALTELGFETVREWLDSFLLRIPPARVLPGDLLLVEGDAGLDCITLCLGTKAFGWHQDAPGATTLVHREVIGAWRA